MNYMIIGIVIFAGMHLFSMLLPAQRDALKAKYGENRWKGGFAIVSFIGLGFMIRGFFASRAGPAAADLLYIPADWTRHVDHASGAARFPFVERFSRQGLSQAVAANPMSIGFALWSFGHLLSNGKRTAVYMFGTFLAVAILDIVLSTMRGKRPVFEPRLRSDVVAVVPGCCPLSDIPVRLSSIHPQPPRGRMIVLALGVVLISALHLAAAVPSLKLRLKSAIGGRAYLPTFGIVSLAAGYHRAWLAHLAPSFHCMILQHGADMQTSCSTFWAFSVSASFSSAAGFASICAFQWQLAVAPLGHRASFANGDLASLDPVRRVAGLCDHAYCPCRGLRVRQPGTSAKAMTCCRCWPVRALYGVMTQLHPAVTGVPILTLTR